ncbi:Uncharacterized protein QTN25_002030 [Entamoeba marina]
MSTSITFFIHYITSFGQNVVINFNDGCSKKMVWRPGHIWTTSYITKKNELKWWYTISSDNIIQRIEPIDQPRSQHIHNENCIKVQDRWGQPMSDIHVMKLQRLKKTKTLQRHTTKPIILPYYKYTQLQRRKRSSQHINSNNKVLPYFKGVRFGCFDDSMIHERRII